jgi:hypothetical protein
MTKVRGGTNGWNNTNVSSGTIVLVLNAVPRCAKDPIFCLSQFEKCGYIEKAQRFLGDN